MIEHGTRSISSQANQKTIASKRSHEQQALLQEQLPNVTFVYCSQRL